jgi:hypothetical protein
MVYGAIVRAAITFLFIFMCCGLANAASVEVSKGELKVTMSAPDYCSRGDNITISIKLEASTGGGGSAGLTYQVTLKEKDMVIHDKIGTQEVVGPRAPGPWTDTVTFQFRPKKFERSRTLELFFDVKRKAGGLPGLGRWTNKSNPLRIKCKR